MRITYVNPVGVVGGAERVMLAAMRAVPGVVGTLVLFGDGPLRAEAERLGVRVVVVPLPGAFAEMGDTQLRAGGKVGRLLSLGVNGLTALPGFVKFRQKLVEAFRDSRPDLIHSNGLKAHLFTALTRPRRVGVVWHLHDFYSHRPLMAKILKSCQRGVVGSVAISEAVARDVRGVLPKLPIRTVLNAVDTEHFAPSPADSGVKLDALAGMASFTGLRVGLIGTYANWKGQEVLLNALAKLPHDLPLRGYIIGGPIYKTAGSQFSRLELESLAARLGLAGRVGFVPFQRDPREAYCGLDVVVHASTRPEPFGLTIAEAMSCGRPVIVAAAGGAKELFTEGQDALGHEPGNADSLAKAILQLATDPLLRSRLSLAARATAGARFSLPRFGSELHAYYRSLLA
ncbi:MAG: glycosyltransferase family 4 protein [Fimbriiglobus sp.]